LDSLARRARGNFFVHSRYPRASPWNSALRVIRNLKGKTMRIMFIDNDGGGFADYIDISAGMNVEQFFKDRMPDRKAENCLIRVNRQPVPRDYVLRENDRITITPTKITGAVS